MSQTLTIYKASAGSGKTFTLTVEYILLLLCKGKDEFQNTLAVTFTNKATAEMKGRILETLYGLAYNAEGSGDYMDRIGERLAQMGQPMSPEMIGKRAKEALTAILHDYTHFRVETIDSFFQSVLHNLAHELGLNANLQVELDTKETVSRAVDRIIENLEDNKDVQQWVLDYVQEQVENNDRWNIMSQIKKFAGCIFEEEFQERPEHEKQKLSDSSLMRDFKSRMHSIIEANTQRLTAAADAWEKMVEGQTMNFDKISNGGRYKTFISNVKGKDGEAPSNTIYKACDDPLTMLRSADQKDPALLADARKTSDELKKLVDLYDTLRYETMTARLALRYLNPLCLLSAIEREVNDINEENNQFVLSKTPALLNKLIKDSDSPFVFEKIGTQLRNVMIDEFQDTSLQQWNNFKVLLLENQSTGGSDLLVGDVKQSIYRWRNGDWAILQNVANELERFAPKVEPLDFNFRSQRNIITFNNSFFPVAAGLLDGRSEAPRFRIADIYSDVCQETKKKQEKGYVYAKLYRKQGKSSPDNYEERMVEDMIARIRQLKEKGVKESQMAILLRVNKDTEKILRITHELAPEIRMVSDEAFLLRASVAVQMIVNALYALDVERKANPIPERYLMMHYRQDVKKEPISIQEIVASEPESILPEEFYAGREQLRKLPLYLLCERLHQIFQLDRIEGQDAYLFTFFDELQNHLRSNPSDIHTFLCAWEESICKKAIPGGDVSGIRIMSIHKSKGLQFHTVLLPYMDWTIEGDIGHDNSIWCESHELQLRDGLGLNPREDFNEFGKLPINTGSKMEASFYNKDFTEEHLQRRVDALNMIYVAFTRAEKNLFIWGMTAGLDSKGKESTSLSIAGDLIRQSLPMTKDESNADELNYTFGTPYVLKDDEEKQEDEDKNKGKKNRLKPSHKAEDAQEIKMTSAQPTLDFMQSNQSKKFLMRLGQEEAATDSRQQSYMEIGKLMHYVLSQIEHKGQVEKVLRQCMADGYIADQQVKQTIIRRLERGFADRKIGGWFSPENEVFNECSITSIDPESGKPCVLRPDRVVMNGNCITVVDFKFGREDDEYDIQVKRYMGLLAKMYPGKKVEGYLWYIYSGKTKEVNL